MILADETRAFAVSHYIKPARRKGAVVPSRVTMLSGDIVRQVKLQQRTPAVCGARDAKKFRTENNLTLVGRTRPKQGMTVTWKFLV
jgi:hypothetical protein